MGIFDWKKRRGKKQTDPASTDELGTEPRVHHYFFAHKVLPNHLWNGDSMLGILANPENQEFTVNIWNELGQQLEPQERIPAVDMHHSSHWIGGEHLVVLIELPLAKFRTEARFVAITTSPNIRYLTLEKSVSDDGSDIFFLCEWNANGDHINYGDGGEPTATTFLHSVCRLLSLPETIEAPTVQQEQGMTRGGQTFYMTDTEYLSEEDERKVYAWEDEAEDAIEADDYRRAEQLYRQILDLRMSRQGPENTDATLAHGELAQILELQGKHYEAEEVCRIWWKYCRRHRMLGHAETMYATRMLATCLRSQGKQLEAEELMAYRVLLGGLSRGADSIVAEDARSDLASFQERNSSA